MARTIDARLGGACPRKIVVAGPTDARALAETCVRSGAHLGAGRDAERFHRAQPLATGLVELATAAGSADESELVALRSLARLAFARGLLSTALRPDAGAPAFQEIEDAEPMTLDADVQRAVGLVTVEHLLSRPGMDARAVVALTARIAARGLDAALEQPPWRTDVETLFSRVRAFALELHPPRAPALSTVELAGDGTLIAEFDGKLRATPTRVRVCGEDLAGVLGADADTLIVTFDAGRCLDVDGARIVTLDVGGRATSPRGVDGAIVRRTFARAERPAAAEADQ